MPMSNLVLEAMLNRNNWRIQPDATTMHPVNGQAMLSLRVPFPTDAFYNPEGPLVEIRDHLDGMIKTLSSGAYDHKAMDEVEVALRPLKEALGFDKDAGAVTTIDALTTRLLRSALPFVPSDSAKATRG